MNEAELLFSEVLKRGRLSLYLNKDYRLTKQEGGRLSCALKKRAQGIPLQYILGHTEFMGLPFKLSPEVLIPRPETEVLVETALRIVKGLAGKGAGGLKILDLGTGSGCIAVSLAKFLPEAKIYASDISAGALEVARQNAALNKADIEFIESDLFSNCKLRARQYELIITNPPYIAGGEIDKLEPEIQYEPRLALDGGGDGLAYFRRIIKEASSCLAGSGLLVMEIGFGQAEEVKQIFQNCPDFAIIEVVKDYNYIERVIVAGIRNG